MCSPNAASWNRMLFLTLSEEPRLTLTRPEVAALPHSAAHVPSKLPSPVYTL